jgi:alkane 1-monooxygenase
MYPLRYLAALIAPISVLGSLLAPGAATFAAVVITFGVFPIVELLFSGTEENLSESEERAAWKDRTFNVLLYAMVPMQFGLLGLYLWRLTYGAPTPLEVAGMTASMGIACGVLGINVAHELGHRRKKSEQTMAKALLLTTLYMHFFIEHNRGHHTRVATEEDPASSRYGESLYAFWLRSMTGSWLGAWALERERLTRRNERVWSWRNEMVRFTVLQLGAMAAIGLGLGPLALGGFIAVSLIGALTLETVNYLEHYGLERARREDGRYERVEPVHSWNSNHPVGRAVLFELSRHSDHHANARRPYQVLRHFDEAPQLPTGYPGMMVLALVPPLWRAVMHPRIEAFRNGGAREMQVGGPHSAAA